MRPSVSAIAANNPSLIVLNHVDHVDVRCRESGNLTPDAAAFIEKVGRAIGSPIRLAGIGQSALVTSSALLRTTWRRRRRAGAEGDVPKYSGGWKRYFELAEGVRGPRTCKGCSRLT